jgi:hypothetical protein
MPRILAACLAVLLTANGWVAMPAGYLDTGRDASRSDHAGKLFQEARSSSRTKADTHRPQAARPVSALLIQPQTLQPIPEKIFEYRSRPADAPQAFRLGQRPPPQTV